MKNGLKEDGPLQRKTKTGIMRSARKFCRKSRVQPLHLILLRQKSRHGVLEPTVVKERKHESLPVPRNGWRTAVRWKTEGGCEPRPGQPGRSDSKDKEMDPYVTSQGACEFPKSTDNQGSVRSDQGTNREHLSRSGSNEWRPFAHVANGTLPSIVIL